MSCGRGSRPRPPCGGRQPPRPRDAAVAGAVRQHHGGAMAGSHRSTRHTGKVHEERGRPRSGGQPGPSTRQAPGGRSWCADPLYPQGGADVFMVDHLPFNRNSFGARFAARLASDEEPKALIGCKPPRTEGWHPAGRGAIDRDPPRVTRRAFCSCRTGTSPSRSVHQWTARAWVPDGVTVVVGLPFVDLPPCVPPPRRKENP